MAKFDVSAFSGDLSEEEVARVFLTLPKGQRDQIMAERAREDFAEFVRQAWPIIERDPIVWGWHVDAICRHLVALSLGEILRLLVNIPPRHGKSNLFAVLWPAWIWTRQPETEFLFLSYAANLAVEHSIKCRQVIESEWYQTYYARPAGWRLREDQNVKHDFMNTMGGRRRATSVSGSITGHGADIIGIDDPLNTDDVYSKAARDETNRIIGELVSTRLNSVVTGRVGMIMQRLHEEDPSNFVLTGNKSWEHLCLPAQFEPDRRSVTHHFVEKRNGHIERVKEEFWRDPRKEAGELLFPERFPLEQLEAMKAPNALGARGFAGQCQQRPAPEGGGMFQTQNWRFWTSDEATLQRLGLSKTGLRPRGCSEEEARPVALDDLDDCLVSVDATFRDTADGSYVAIHVWGRLGARRLLLDRVHRRMDFTDTVKALLQVIERWPEARRKLVEGKANGDAIISTLERSHGVSGCEAVNPGKQSKVQRAHAMQPYQSAGNVELPEGAPWLEEYVAEHAVFPNGAHDDDVDAQSQGLQGLEREKTSMEMWMEVGLD